MRAVEIDAVAAKRDDRDTDSFTKDIVDEMLTQMEGVSSSGRHVFVLGATNHPENIDPAILRRFSFKIEIPNPDAEQRRKLFDLAQGFTGVLQLIDKQNGGRTFARSIREEAGSNM